MSSRITSDDLQVLLDNELTTRGVFAHHLESIDRFYNTGINHIATHGFVIETTVKNERTKTEEDNLIDTVHVVCNITGTYLGNPTYYNKDKQEVLTPNKALRENLTYTAPLYYDAHIIATAYMKDGTTKTREETVDRYRVANVPIMIGSQYCNTYNKTKQMLKIMHQDPNDHGAYFIIKGNEWVVDNVENLTFNQFHVYKNIGHKDEICHGDFISKPGDGFENSAEIIIKLLTNGNLVCEITNQKIKDVSIPFYLLFRALGAKSDKEIIDNIIYTYEGDISNHMQLILDKAFNSIYKTLNGGVNVRDQVGVLSFLSNGIASLNANFEKRDDNTLKYFNNNILNILDKYLFPHIGITPDARHKKIRFLGHLIYKLILVEYDIVESTDRDSYKNKRVYAAGNSFSKIFKTFYNFSVVTPVKKHFAKDIKSMPFSHLPLAQTFKSAVNETDFEKALIQSVITGDKTMTITKRKVPNRLSSQQLHRKNVLNVISVGRQVNIANTSSSKQSERADEMRRAHPTYIGYICPIQSPVTGEGVGMKKQMGMSASICAASSSSLLKSIVSKIKTVVLLDNISPSEIGKYKNIFKIFVNGDWIGVVSDGFLTVNFLRYLRRNKVIDPYTTIFLDVMVSEIYLWVDFGRITRPLLIVYNNLPSQDFSELAKEFDIPIPQTQSGGVLPQTGGVLSQTEDECLLTQHSLPKSKKGGKANSSKPADLSTDKSSTDKLSTYKLSKPSSNFSQWINITMQDISDIVTGKITVKDLHNRQVIEYITPEEAENCLICTGVEKLNTLSKDASSTNVIYTHCEIAQSIVGIPCLTSPYAGHNQATRIIYQTNQVKQTCGWFAANYPYRADKDAVLQYYCGNPIVRTLANNYITPIGSQTMVAIQCYSGYNQEDSIICNDSAMDRCLFDVSYFTYEQTDLDKGDIFMTPNVTETIDMKGYANYTKLVNGVIPKGTIVRKNDVIIGKVAEIPKTQQDTDQFKYLDKSIVYKLDEESSIYDIIEGKNSEDIQFVKIILRSKRKVKLGDKFSSRSGQKGVVGISLRHCDMPFTSDGIVPDLIINPHAIPTRMTIGQNIEGLQSKLNCLLGVTTDGTVFKNIDVKGISDSLVKLGYSSAGTEKMYDGRTGEAIDYEIFVTPTYYQRLQKFTTDAVFAVMNAPTCAITRQPIGGKSSGGGLRIGEMEKDVLCVQGAMRILDNKFYKDSDGYNIYVCRNCGKQAIYNPNYNIYKCNTESCKSNEEIVEVRSSWSVKTFFDELHAMGINTSFGIEPFVKESTLPEKSTLPAISNTLPEKKDLEKSAMPEKKDHLEKKDLNTLSIKEKNLEGKKGGNSVPRSDSGKQVRYLFQNQNQEVCDLRDNFIAKFICGTKLYDHPKLADDIVKEIYKILDDITLMKKYDNNVLEDDVIYHKLCEFYHANIKVSDKPNDWSREENRIKSVTPLLKNFIEIKKSINYLDVGCNEGNITKTIGEYLKAKTIEGCDIVDSLKNRNFNFHLLEDHEKYSLTHYKTSSKDFISTFMSLHHIEELETEIKAIYRILKKDGVFLIREHDLDSDNLCVALDLMHAFYDYVWKKPEVKEGIVLPSFRNHFANYYSQNMLREIIEKCGFKEVSHSTPLGLWRPYQAAFVKREFWNEKQSLVKSWFPEQVVKTRF